MPAQSNRLSVPPERESGKPSPSDHACFYLLFNHLVARGHHSETLDACFCRSADQTDDPRGVRRNKKARRCSSSHRGPSRPIRAHPSRVVAS